MTKLGRLKQCELGLSSGDSLAGLSYLPDHAHQFGAYIVALDHLGAMFPFVKQRGNNAFVSGLIGFVGLSHDVRPAFRLTAVGGEIWMDQPGKRAIHSL